MFGERKYMNCYNADVKRDDLRIYFQRLFRDARDVMSDCVKPQWEAEDEFIITIYKMETTYINETKTIGDATIRREGKDSKELDRLEIKVESKEAANYIWYLGKKTNTTFEQIKAMVEAKKFQ